MASVTFAKKEHVLNVNPRSILLWLNALVVGLMIVQSVIGMSCGRRLKISTPKKNKILDELVNLLQYTSFLRVRWRTHSTLLPLGLLLPDYR